MNTKTAFVILCCVLLLTLSACGDTYNDIPASKERADEIVHAIDAYAQKHEQFPERLEDLVPEFIAEIPTTVGGRDFLYYQLTDPDEYLLGFRVTDKKNLGCGYGSRSEDWECSFGAE